MDKPPANFYRKNSPVKFLLLLFYASVCFSCQMASPAILDCNSRIALDYSDDKSVCAQKLIVFLKLGSEVRRVDQIRVVHNQTGYTWIVNNPIIVHKSSDSWAGFTDLAPVPQAGSGLPSGEYNVYCRNVDGEETVSFFILDYDAKYSSLKAGQAFSEIQSQGGFVKTIGIYEDNGTLVYYGAIRDSWNITKTQASEDLQNVWQAFNQASFIRMFYSSNKITLIMPPVYKEIHEEEIDISQEAPEILTDIESLEPKIEEQDINNE